MKWFNTFLFIVFNFTQLNAQIKWDEKRPLNWKDFSGVIDYSSQHYANTKTSTNYQYQVHYHKNIYKLTFDVACVFLPNGSWCKPYKQTQALLHHEQLHFDIQEIFARRLIAAFNAAIYTTNYQTEVKTIYNDIAQQANNMQQQYDAATNYGELKKEQLKWENLVHAQLK